MGWRDEHVINYCIERLQKLKINRIRVLVAGNAEIFWGEPVMTGADGKPLLLLSRFGEGRVALLLSDHIWLWARGYEGGGPHLDLLRRMSHWLMKQPDLDEEALRLQVQGHDLVVLRQTMADSVSPVTVTSPTGAGRELTLSQSEPGTWRSTIPANELGLWQATDGTLKALINVGPTNPKEFSEVTSTPDSPKPLAQAERSPTRKPPIPFLPKP